MSRVSVVPQLHWVRRRAGGRWHAWAHGAVGSLCGNLLSDHLRRPGKASQVEIQRTAPPDQAWCTRCASTCRSKGWLLVTASDSTQDSGPVLSSAARAWASCIRLHCRHAHTAAPSVEDVTALAIRLAECGAAPEALEAREAWAFTKDVLLHRPPRRGGSWARLRKALLHIPEGPDGWSRVVAHYRAWQTLASSSAQRQVFHADNVVEGMAALPAEVAQSWVQTLLRKWGGPDHIPLARVYHKATITSLRRDPTTRGVSAGSVEYWERTKDDLNIVRDA